MPRTARRDAPGAVHHVLLRGIERREIFRDLHDRESFLDRLDRVLPECGVGCFAWALMPNHVHLVLRTGAIPLATAMARVATGHAVYFNRRHDRVGHLFQNRYKAIPVFDEDHLRVLIRYVHRNPLRAGLLGSLDELERHAWTGHAALVGRSGRPFHDVNAALSLFGRDRAAARHRLRAWMEAPDADRPPAEPPFGPDASLEALVDRVAGAYGVARQELLGGSRRRAVSLARAAISFLGSRCYGVPAAQLAAVLGVSEEAIRRAASREARRRGAEAPDGAPGSRGQLAGPPRGSGTVPERPWTAATR